MTDRPALATMVIQANPVPDPVATAEHLDAYQSLLTLIDERSGAMDHHTKQADTPTTPPPPTRSRAAAWAFAAAFVLILVVIGAAALFLRGDDSQVTDEPATSTTVAESAVPTTAVSEQPTSRVVLGPDAFSDGWQQVAVDEPWVQSIVEIDALPGGGFFVAATDPWTLRWSPDGSEWFDADPQHLTDHQSSMELFDWIRIEYGGLVTVAGDDVLILNQTPLGVWVGNPRTGAWRLVPLDTTGLQSDPTLLSVASSDTEAMVVAELTPGNNESRGGDNTVWLIDLATGTSQRHALPERPAGPKYDAGGGAGWAQVVWFSGKWLVIPDCNHPYSLVYVSTDGTNWVESRVAWARDATPPDQAKKQGYPRGGWPGVFGPGDAWPTSGLQAMTTSPDAIIGNYFLEPFAYSEDGLRWLPTDSGVFPSPDEHGHFSTMTYSEDLGYVTIGVSGSPGEPQRVFIVSEDGKTWREAGQEPQPTQEYPMHLTASGRILMGNYRSQTEPHEVTLTLWTAD